MNAIQANLAGVREQANNREMKEIKGISKRFAQLDHHLRIAEGRRFIFITESVKVCVINIRSSCIRVF